MWKDSIRDIVVIFQSNILRIVGFYVRHSAMVKFCESAEPEVDQIPNEFLYEM